MLPSPSGSARAAVLTHGNLRANLEQMMGLPGEIVRADDVSLAAVPLFHVFGLNVALGLTLASGGALTVVSQGEQSIIGSSRFDHYDRSRSEIEIGWTFIARSCWGGAYNGEIKRLMLRHAFGSVRNVVFKIHSDNMRSRRAVEKLGAISIAMEPDAEGRGDNCVYRLERTTYFEQAEPSAPG